MSGPQAAGAGGDAAPGRERAAPAGAGHGSGGADSLEGARILLVDDDAGLREMLSILLASRGAQVSEAAGGHAAIARLGQHEFETIITDISMPQGDGHEVLAAARSQCPGTPVIMLTAVAKDVADAVEAVKRGAFDYIQKGFFDNDEFIARVAKAVEHARLREENLRLRRRLGDRRQAPVIVGDASRMLGILNMVERVAATSSTVLVTGESGTGKELIARTLHANSGRRGRFLTVNCAALPDELLESELFGHARGAFTGAVAAKKGLFEEADRGTLFLDEIGETSPALQVKLLRVLQEGTFRPVGASEERRADVRIITATNRDLEAMVRDGAFREDLFYRINVIPIHVPPLRERREDIQAMVMHFVRDLAGGLGRAVPRVTPEAMERLESYPWPGNVRELRNVIERAIALTTSDELDVSTLPERVREGRPPPRRVEEQANSGFLPDGVRLDDFLDDLRRRCIEQALLETGGNQTRAAERLQVTFRALRYYVQKYGIRLPGGDADDTRDDPRGS